MQISFKGRKVVVAGGSRGIGRSIALAFAEEGADVAICARNAEGLTAAEVELKRHGGTVFSMPCDLGDASAPASFVTGGRWRARWHRHPDQQRVGHRREG